MCLYRVAWPQTCGWRWGERIERVFQRHSSPSLYATSITTIPITATIVIPVKMIIAAISCSLIMCQVLCKMLSLHSFVLMHNNSEREFFLQTPCFG